MGLSWDGFLGTFLGALLGFLGGLILLWVGWSHEKGARLESEKKTREKILGCMRMEIQANKKRVGFEGGIVTVPLWLASWDSLLLSGLVTTIGNDKMLTKILQSNGYGKAYNNLLPQLPTGPLRQLSPEEEKNVGAFNYLREVLSNLYAELDHLLQEDGIEAVNAPQGSM